MLVKAVKAQHGEKMIEIRLRFHTDCMDDDAEKILPKHGWDAGFVVATTNDTHGIKRSAEHQPVPFNSFPEMYLAIEEVIIQQGITLHQASRSRKYCAVPDPKAAARKQAKAQARKETKAA